MLAAFAGTLALRRRGERYVSTGLLLIGVAAFIGTLRFGVNPELNELHRFVSSLATCTGLPLIAVQYLATHTQRPGRDGRMNTMGASVVGFAMFGLAFPMEVYVKSVGAVSMLLVIGAAAKGASRDRRRAGLAIGGALVFLLAGLVVGTTGTLGPFLRLDLFHLLLTVATLAIAAGLPDRSPDW